MKISRLLYPGVLLSIMWTSLVNISSGQYVPDRPKLVIGIVVDQMRHEYLYRFYDEFGDGGFRRILDEGFSYANVHYNYVPTYTAAGHASIYTGTTPCNHGIVGNSWFHRALDTEVYCTLDDSVGICGGEGRGMSPIRLKSTTITDELKLATNGRSKVIGISLKDRGSILPAGHMADAAYWLDDSGIFVSSTFYMDQLPDWVMTFNESPAVRHFFKSPWTPEDNANFDLSLPDKNSYESLLGEKSDPVFPYDLTEWIKKGGLGAIRRSPFGNELLIDFAQEAIEQEHMGADETTDFLCLSFSSTDYIGHAMGPRSREIQDTYLKLDKQLARLLDFLDNTIGKDEYLIFLTADHAVNEVPAHLRDMGFYAETVSYSFFADKLKAFSEEKYGVNLIKNYGSGNIHLDYRVIEENDLEIDDVSQAIVDYLMGFDVVHRVYTQDQILSGNPSDPLLTKVFKGYDPKQNGQLVMTFVSGSMEYKSTGSTHGSAYNYDTHVPMLWYGKHIPNGKSLKAHYITEIAATLGHILGITTPSAADNNLMQEVIPSY